MAAAGARPSLRISPREEDAQEEERRHSARRSWGSSSAGGRGAGGGILVFTDATGTREIKLPIDAARALGGEVVNTDKIQLYAGLDITNNPKVPVADPLGVPHHLLGAFRPEAGVVPPSSFPSNSFIHALLADRFDASRLDPFAPGSLPPRAPRPVLPSLGRRRRRAPRQVPGPPRGRHGGRRHGGGAPGLLRLDQPRVRGAQ